LGGRVLGEADGVAVAVFEFEFFHLVEGDLGFAGNFGALGFEFVVEGVEIVAAHVDVPGEIGMSKAVGSDGCVGTLATEKELDAVAMEDDEAGWLAPVALEGEAEDVAVVLGGCDDVVDEKAGAKGEEVAAGSVVGHGESSQLGVDKREKYRVQRVEEQNPA
jgi:hypothetical protein